MEYEIPVTQTGETSFMISREGIEAIHGNSAADRKQHSSNVKGGKEYARGSQGALTAVVGLAGEAAFQKLMTPERTPVITLGRFDDGIDAIIERTRDKKRYNVEVKTNPKPPGRPRTHVHAPQNGKWVWKKPSSLPNILVSGYFTRKVWNPKDCWTTPIELAGYVFFSFESFHNCADCRDIIEQSVSTLRHGSKGNLCPLHNSFQWIAHVNHELGINIIPRHNTLQPIGELAARGNLVIQ